jgi:hypothetical protein
MNNDMQPITISETATTISLTWMPPESIPSALADLALTTLFQVTAPWCQLLAIEAALTYVNAEYWFDLDEPTPPQRFWLLAHDPLPPHLTLHPMWNGSRIISIPQLNLPASQTWFAQMMAELAHPAPPPDAVLGWSELRCDTALVRLPAGLLAPGTATLPVHERQNQLDYPVVWQDASAWVGGPLPPYTRTAPVEWRLSNTCGMLTLEINSYWSLWRSEDGAGWPMLQQTIDTLRTAGWQVEHPNHLADAPANG